MNSIHQNARGALPGRLVCIFALVALAACGRSEEVGWQDREAPDRSTEEAAGETPDPSTIQGQDAQAEGAPEAAAEPSDPTQGASEAVPGEIGSMAQQALMREYQSLAQSLSSLRQRAMQDEALAARWDEIRGDVEAHIVAENPEYERLIARWHEIRQRVQEIEQSGESLSQEERQRLGSQWRNIQATLQQAQRKAFQHPSIEKEMNSFEVALQDKMAELAPDRAADIRRMERIGERINELADSAAHAANQGSGPAR